MPENSDWQGKSRGGLTGHKIFVFILKTFGLNAAYFVLRFVAFYFFVFARSTSSVLKYFREIHGYSGIRLYRAAYQNYYLFGQVLIDKVAFLSGSRHKYKGSSNDPNQLLEQLSARKTGAILLSAHIGNWEIAGQRLNRLQTQFNILMYDNEIEKMKAYLNKIMVDKAFNIIAIRQDMSHLVEIHKALSNKEIIVMHGDRHLEGSETITMNFMGKPARFPAGPFIMAAKFGVPIVQVYSVKDGKFSYRYFAMNLIDVKRSRKKEEIENEVKRAAGEYIKTLEDMLRLYPTQWFNFYDFWKA